MSEGGVAAHFEYLCALKGSQRPAYVPVVASGSNALVIHYTANDHIMQSGDLVLVDAGCELKSVFQILFCVEHTNEETLLISKSSVIVVMPLISVRRFDAAPFPKVGSNHSIALISS